MKTGHTRAPSVISRRTALAASALARSALPLNARGIGAFAQTASPAATPLASPVEFLWESRGDPDSPLGNPPHLAIAPDGSIWVADGDNNRFQIFAPDGRFLETWGTTGSSEGKFDFTTIGWGGYDQGAIAFAPDGSFYIADVGNYRIQKFNPDRQFLTAWGTKGIWGTKERDDGQFLP